MARRKKVLESKDYTLLISELEQEINNLVEEVLEKRQAISEKKKELKKLYKDRDTYEAQKEKEEKENAAKEMVEEILASGKTLDDIKAFLSSNKDEKKSETK